MQLTVAYITSAGPVREKNEDSMGFWEPPDDEGKRQLGAVAVIADGVGGQGAGDVASGLAVGKVIETFQLAQEQGNLSAGYLLGQIFNSANIAVYDGRQEGGERARMATTLTVALLKHNQVDIGHVGDCRAYHLSRGRIKRLTTDHSYVGMQQKLGLIREQDAMNSPLRSVLTKSVGTEIIIRPEHYNVTVAARDRIILCSDGLHGVVTESELGELGGRGLPHEAATKLIELGVRRGTDDNLTVMILQVETTDQVSLYKGLPFVQKVSETPMVKDLQEGEVLDDRFEVLGVVNRSGMATIYKAHDTKTGDTVAIKVPFMQFESDPGFFSRFVREEEIGLRLNHPYILKFVKGPEHKSRPYIVMEFLEGETLGSLLSRTRPLLVDEALTIATRVCEALQYLHSQDIVHRDLKPHNIMLCTDGTIRIMDFGIAKAAGTRRITFMGFSPTLGTPDYMAPEQVKGKRGDARTDIYALGCILYEMCTGQTPFEGQNAYMIMNARLSGDPVAPRKINPEIPPQVEEIILHAMERFPGARYSSAAEMQKDLEHPDQVVVTTRAQTLRPPAPWRGRFWWLKYALLFIMVPLAIVGAWVIAAKMMHH